MELTINIPDSEHRIRVRVSDELTVGKIIESVVETLRLARFDPISLQDLKYVLSTSESELPTAQIDPSLPANSQLVDGATLVLRTIRKSSSIVSSGHGLATFHLSSNWSVQGLEGLLRTLREPYIALLTQNEILKEAKSENHARYYPDDLASRHEKIAGNIRTSEDLLVKRIEINSPGILEIIGSLNPLETIRRFLKDHREANAKKRTEAREDSKDKLYRTAIDQAKAVLEVENLKTQVARERAVLLRDAGFPQEQIRPYISALIERPLEQLAVYQTNGILECIQLETLEDQKIELTEVAHLSGLSLPGPPRE